MRLFKDFFQYSSWNKLATNFINHQYSSLTIINTEVGTNLQQTSKKQRHESV